jgi:hypothetical protein
MTLVETASPSAATDFTISNLVVGTKYMLKVVMTQNTTGGQCIIRFNADSGNNCAAQAFGASTTNTIGFEQSANSGLSSVYINYGYAGDSFSTTLFFETANSNSHSVIISFIC